MLARYVAEANRPQLPDVDLRDHHECTPLHVALLHGGWANGCACGAAARWADEWLQLLLWGKWLCMSRCCTVGEQTQGE